MLCGLHAARCSTIRGHAPQGHYVLALAQLAVAVRAREDVKVEAWGRRLLLCCAAQGNMLLLCTWDPTLLRAGGTHG